MAEKLTQNPLDAELLNHRALATKVVKGMRSRKLNMGDSEEVQLGTLLTTAIKSQLRAGGYSQAEIARQVSGIGLGKMRLIYPKKSGKFIEANPLKKGGLPKIFLVASASTVTAFIKQDDSSWSAGVIQAGHLGIVPLTGEDPIRAFLDPQLWVGQPPGLTKMVVLTN